VRGYTPRLDRLLFSCEKAYYDEREIGTYGISTALFAHVKEIGLFIFL
jgi:hypothetical protein